MTKVFWRPHKVSRIELGLVTILALAGVVGVERFTVVEKQDFYEEKLEAARKARRAFETIRNERIARGHTFDSEVDPAQTGMVGLLMSPVTTNSGHLPSKQISVNPNFAALVVHYLRRLQVEEGDVVAVGLSGSFPAINIAVFAAIETIGADPIVISSASASQFGANDPDLGWLDMERLLQDRGVFKTRSIATSRGGIEDKGLGVTRVGRALLDEAMKRSGARVIKAGTYAESVSERMSIYNEVAEGRPIKAYINVGGGTTSVGTKVGKRLFKPGINRSLPDGTRDIDSVMTRFVVEGVPVVHLVKIADLAQRYGFPLTMDSMPAAGQGRIFTREVYNDWLAAGIVAVVLLALIGFVRMDWGFRVFKMTRSRGPRKAPEQMV